MSNLKKLKPAQENILTTLGSVMDTLQTTLIPEDTQEGGLAKAWHYLQVYSKWGARLPNDNVTLDAALEIDSAEIRKFNPEVISKIKSSTFYQLMLKGYQEIFRATRFFDTEIRTKIDDLNHSMLRYAEKAEGGPEYKWIIDKMDEAETKEGKEQEDALKIVLKVVEKLLKQSQKNEQEASDVKKSLEDYLRRLAEAEGTVKKATNAVETDKTVSQDRINELLERDPDAKGYTKSIAYFKDMIDKLEEEYKFDVVVASTTPTYAWVPFLGWLAGPIVAGIYGDKARKALEEIRDNEGKFAAANTELVSIQKVHSTQELATNGLTKAMRFTQIAISHTETVKKAWSDLTSNLRGISENVENMLFTNGDGERELEDGFFVKEYAEASAERWMKLMPTVKAMTDGFNIVFKNGNQTIDELLAEIELKLNDPAKKN